MAARAFCKEILFFITSFWKKTLHFSDLSISERFVFYILCFFEQVYKIIFGVALYFKRRSAPFRSKLRVLSVGNLSVGGTGKSVLVSFLVQNLPQFHSLVVLRGYRGENEKNKKSFFVSDGVKMFCAPSFCGDEAFMFATFLKVPVVVGANRGAACRLVEKKSLCMHIKKPGLIFLDDAYQNFQVKKDCQVLLLDARKPFENGHCLPAGRLREKDFSRADFILLTHSDKIARSQLHDIKKNLLSFPQEDIFCVRHKINDVSLFGVKPIALQGVERRRFFVIAGIGSFDYFLENIKELKVEIFGFQEYPDHCKYTKRDVKFLANIVHRDDLDGVITTQKDWVKLKPIVEKLNRREMFNVYVVGVTFDFLIREKKIVFLQKIEEILKA